MFSSSYWHASWTFDSILLWFSWKAGLSLVKDRSPLFRLYILFFVFFQFLCTELSQGRTNTRLSVLLVFCLGEPGAGFWHIVTHFGLVLLWLWQWCRYRRGNLGRLGWVKGYYSTSTPEALTIRRYHWCIAKLLTRGLCLYKLFSVQSLESLGILKKQLCRDRDSTLQYTVGLDTGTAVSFWQLNIYILSTVVKADIEKQKAYSE